MSNPLKTFLDDVRAVRSTGQATAEQSYYPAVYTLLTAIGNSGNGPVRHSALQHPAGVEGNFPDVAIYETESRALALPVEVKAANADLRRLASSAQALRYATTFGGGVVLVTNLRQWALAEVDENGHLQIRATVEVAATEAALDAPSTLDLDRLWTQLKMLVADGLVERASQGSPKVLASLLAYHARNMRDAITAAGNPSDLLASLNEALSRGLHIELEDEHLTPTVVQTLVYGAFAAWLNVDKPQRFDWMQASYRLTVPVFAEILHAALRPTLLRKCDLTPHLKSVERVLRWTDRDRFTKDFDGDAIQYFYEPFLAEFDATLRSDLGVWYTPKEIADYQVARAHHHVTSDLGISDGLADESVYLLDPAAGTGTYLIAAIDFLCDLHKANGEPESVAAQRALDAMLTRFIGFEILPAAFIICHLHLARRLAQHGAALDETDRLRVYLTNSLTGWDPDSGPEGLTLFPELETELHDAAIAKQRDPVVVVLGNPPYHGFSSAESDEERAMLKPWVDELMPVWGLRKHRMNDLYVRFWRMSIHRILNLTERGIVSFITNRKWLGGRSYPSMRAAVVNGFHDVWVDDLHGDVHDRSHAGDQSIFTTNIATGIRVGTAIVTAVKRDHAVTSEATVMLADYRGAAADKRELLNQRRNAAMNTGYRPVTVSRASRYRLASDAGDDHPTLDEYFPLFFSGVQPTLEERVMAFEKQTIVDRFKDYFNPQLDWEALIRLHPALGAGARAQAVWSTLRQATVFDAKAVVPFLYRPFDVRYLYWETQPGLLHRHRREMQPYERNVTDQVWLVAPQTRRRAGAARPLASRAVAGYHSVDPDARAFPLYTFALRAADTTDEEGLPLDVEASTAATTCATEWAEAVARLLSVDEKSAGETVFFALVAITHSTDWLSSQAAEADEFPMVPLPADANDLRAAAEIGRRITDLMDMRRQVDGVTRGTIQQHLRSIAVADQVAGHQQLIHGRAGVTGGLRDGRDVMWDDQHGWRDVPDEVWGYNVGGFQVLSKWLSYRRETGLTVSDRREFPMLCRRIQAIIDSAPACDRLYASAINNPLAATNQTETSQVGDPETSVDPGETLDS